MLKHLYFTCPTDHLETIINKSFEQENYFVSSLGNSVSFTSEFVNEVSSFIKAKSINKITFILSHNNRIIAKGDKCNNEIEVKNFLKLINNKSEESHNTCEKFNFQNSSISYYLNLKIKELELKLKNRCSETININAKIYNRQKNAFSEFQFDLVHLDYFNLN